jgi:Fic family protein
MAAVAGSEVPIVWAGRRARAFVPALLAERDLSLQPDTIARTARAGADISRAAEDMPADHAALARLLLRAEGVASSYIEGVSAPVVEVVLAEEGRAAARSTAGWVAANLAAVADAIDAAHARPLSLAQLCAWHTTLMAGSPIPQSYVGVVRREQGWIGGTSPLDAHLVTPPPEFLPDLLADLVRFANHQDVDPIAQAAVVHAQFELIHPFADGNGRVGRVLVAWILTRRLALLTPPPVSTRIATDVGGYTAGLALYRLGQHDPWVRWFADAVSGAGRAQGDLVAAVARLRQQWWDQLGASREGRRVRSDATAWQVLGLLPGHLVLTARVVAEELRRPTKTAHGALQLLSEVGILTAYGDQAPTGRGRPAHLYVSTDLLGLTGSPPLR